MTEPEPTAVFTRFPWVQLVFCLACLSMAAWMWMRYSYAWDVSEWAAKRHRYSYNLDWPNGAYVRIDGVVASLGTAERAGHRRSDPVIPMVVLKPVSPPNDISEYARQTFFVSSPPTCSVGDRVTMVGRMHLIGMAERVPEGQSPYLSLQIDGRRSRIVPPTVAGLVVGAMGCFIFGLYFREWLRARKALAQAPEQDMIA